MKKIIILGSTGNLGTQTLELLEKYRDEFELIGLSAHENNDLLDEQAKKFSVLHIVLSSRDGEQALTELAKTPEADIIVNVLSGICGISPTRAALEAGKTVLLANKESLIAEGQEFMQYASQIIPVDSEHNAIYEILHKFPDKKIENITIPCSGGPFFGRSKEDLKNVTVKDVLAHPRWDMGAKISVESAALINKGLEVIEAYYLFNLPFEKIKVVIHPECLVHGMVEFTDGQEYAYFSPPDMREHIENTLLHAIDRSPEREIRPLKANEFTFSEPDHKTFPGIKILLAHFQKDPSKMRDFLRKEEEIITQFLQEKIRFLEIYKRLQSRAPL
jgi:1-deoxy-D-xylulose-5-phosphate reductoisomerase